MAITIALMAIINVGTKIDDRLSNAFISATQKSNDKEVDKVHFFSVDACAPAG